MGFAEIWGDFDLRTGFVTAVVIVPANHLNDSWLGDGMHSRLVNRPPTAGFSILCEWTTGVSDTLLDKVAAGDSAAVSACIERYSRLVWSLAKRFLADTTEAEDAVQEIFVDLWKHADRFDPQIASESTFVTTVARRRLIDRCRKRSRAPQLAPLHDDVAHQQPSAIQALETTEQAARIQACMKELRTEERQVLELAILEGASQSAIADQLQMPLGTVKSHARRGMQRLRELVESRSKGVVS